MGERIEKVSKKTSKIVSYGIATFLPIGVSATFGYLDSTIGTQGSITDNFGGAISLGDRDAHIQNERKVGTPDSNSHCICINNMGLNVTVNMGRAPVSDLSGGLFLEHNSADPGKLPKIVFQSPPRR